MPKDDLKCESFTEISIDPLLTYGNKYYLHVYLDNCVYKIVNKQMVDYLDEIFFLKIRYYKCCITIEFI